MRKVRGKDGKTGRFEGVSEGRKAMRVLQITAFSGWGCTGRIALGIHNALIEQGHESAIAWGRINTAPESVVNFKIGNKLDQQLHGFYTRITDKCGFASKGVTKEFIKQIDEYKPDLIQLHILHGYYINIEALFTYLKEKKIPVVWTFHDCWGFTGHCPYFDLVRCEEWKTGCHDCPQKSHHPTSWLLDNSRWNWKKKKELFTAIDNLIIVTPSEWLAGLVKQSFLKGKEVIVINNGIDTNTFKPTDGDFRKKYQLEDKKIILGVSSTWCKSKGIDDFIELSMKLPDEYKIVLVGLNKNQLKELPDSVLGIQRTDSVQELAEIYTTADVFVNPTYEDNYPTTNLEALACGTPVVTYETGGSVEVAGDKWGRIIKQGDVEALREYIVNEQWMEISEESCVIRASNFAQENRFEEYVDLYQKVIEETNYGQYPFGKYHTTDI